MKKTSIFVHIHLHTWFSLLDGHGSPKSRVKKAKELGMKALAITDHNALYGCPDFQDACKEEGIKPLLGAELYYTEDTSTLVLPLEEKEGLTEAQAKKKASEKRKKIATDKAIEDGIIIPPKATKKTINELIAPYEYDTKQFHLLFLAKNQTGWHNLIKLQSEAASKCTFNARFCCDNKMINKYKDGLIMTTACLGNIVNNLFLKENFNKAYKILDSWHEMFGEDFYIEIQPLLNEEQAFCNFYLIEYALKNNIEIIATNDVHYTNKEDYDDHDTLLCIGTGAYKNQENRMRYDHEFWMRSYDEMIEAFSNQYDNNKILNSKFKKSDYIEIIEEALNTTNKIADKIDGNIKIGSDKPILPKVNIPGNYTAEQYLTLISFQGLYKYLAKNKDLNHDEYIKRLDFELSVINTKGYADYMLIVKDIIDWCEINDIPTGPGRGSASGSLVLFVNNITKCVDPIKYKLLFSRFLTLDRTALPDIDSDFSYLKRHKVIQYLKDKYGEDCVSFIGTFTELGVKNGLKDVGRVFNIDFSIMNSITKQIDIITDENPSISFKLLDDLINGTEREKKKYKQFKELENKYSDIFRLARIFEGTPRNAGVHASGVLVTPIPINDMFPTRCDSDNSLVTLYPGPEIERLNGVKIDVLGLRTLDVLDLTVKAVNPKDTIYNLYDTVNNHLSDEKMYDPLNNKETEGIFQLESALFKRLIGDMRPSNIEDITVITAVARPGPLGAGLHTKFANRKKKEEKITEPLPNTYDIVEDSLGVLIYQEHCMQIAQRVAGFNDNQADSFLRKSMAKKRRELMALCDQWFIYGKINSEPPKDYDYDNKKQPYYDPTGKYGDEILGGINNGYDEKQLTDYTIMIADFSSYLFNKSHASSYSLLSCCSMYLKTYHKVEFFAALLSLQDKKEKIDLYCRVADEYGIEIKTPDINLSKEFFTVADKKILYGLNSIKGIGSKAVSHILELQPYNNLEDAYSRLGTKSFNKKIGEALIKAGAFDSFDKNRNNLLNKFQIVRKASKKEDEFNINEFNREICMQYEKDTLGSSITYKTFWRNVLSGETVSVECPIIEVSEITDKNENLMAFIKVIIDNEIVNGVVFSKIYSNYGSIFNKNCISNIRNKDTDEYKTMYLEVKKDENSNLIVNKVLKNLPKSKNKQIFNDFFEMIS